MLGVGLSLSAADFRNVFKHPSALISALTVQIFIVPIIAFIVAYISPMNPEMKAGLVIVATCASGAASNLITHLFKGRVALAISMTIFNGLLTLLTVPVTVSFALYFFLETSTKIVLPIGPTIFQIFLISIIPALLGVYLRSLNKEFAARVEKPLKIIMPVMLASVFLVKIFADKNIGGTDISINEAIVILPVALLLNFLAMSAGFWVMRLLKFDFKTQFTISIEVGLHNTALALMIAGTMIRSTDMEKPAIVYAAFSFFTAVIFVLIVRKIFGNKK
jgi:bile acid:Na+ symporter, BASS family